MRRLFILLLAVVALMPAVRAGGKSAPDTISVKRAFVDYPLVMLDLLKRNTRLDMLDYYEADSIYAAPNAMEGLSRLVSVTDDYLKVQLTPVTTLQLKVLKMKNNSDIVVSVYTIGDSGHASDSDLKVFDSNMNELNPKKYFRIPEVSDFFNVGTEGKKKMKEIEELVPFPTIEYSLSGENGDLSAHLTVGTFMGKEDYDVIHRYEIPGGLLYQWNGTGFKMK